MGGPGMSRCISYETNGDFPGTYVCLPEGNPWSWREVCLTSRRRGLKFDVGDYESHEGTNGISIFHMKTHYVPKIHNSFMLLHTHFFVDPMRTTKIIRTKKTRTIHFVFWKSTAECSDSSLQKALPNFWTFQQDPTDPRSIYFHIFSGMEMYLRGNVWCYEKWWFGRGTLR